MWGVKDALSDVKYASCDDDHDDDDDDKHARSEYWSVGQEEEEEEEEEEVGHRIALIGHFINATILQWLFGMMTVSKRFGLVLALRSMITWISLLASIKGKKSVWVAE